MENFCQFWIIIFGCAAVWFISRKEHWSRWGYIFGLISQPAWIYTAIKHDQWGILCISLWYSYCWAKGIWNFWLVDKDK